MSIKFGVVSHNYSKEGNFQKEGNLLKLILIFLKLFLKEGNFSYLAFKTFVEQK